MNSMNSMNSKNTSRGAIEYDFVIATAIFLTVYASLFTSLPTVSVSFKTLEDPAYTGAVYLSEKMISSPGFPKKWASLGEASELGLAYYDGRLFPNILDVSKVSQLPAYSCTAVAAKTPVSSGLSFKISVENSTVSFSCTGTPASNARIIERPVYLKNSSVFLSYKLKVWVW